jgi:phosphate/sulfate permease
MERSMQRALILGVATMFIGAIYLGGNVTRTIGNGIINSDALTITGGF